MGGVTSSVIRLARAMHDQGDRVSILTTTSRVNRRLSSLRESFAEFYLLQCKSPYNTPLYFLEFAWLAAKSFSRSAELEEVDVIHGHSGYPQLAHLTAALGKLNGIPAVHSFYCPIGDGYRFRPLPLGISVTGGLSAAVSTTRNVAETLKLDPKASPKVRIVPPPIDDSLLQERRSRQEFRAKLGIEEHEFVAVFVGNLSPSKGLMGLLHALARTVPAISQFRLIVTLEVPKRGDDARYLAMLEAISRLGLSERISILGIQESIADLLHASDLLVVPWHDTFGPSDYPIVAMEAMCTGTPVLASRVGGIPELLDNGELGYLFDVSGGPVELAGAIGKVFKSRDEAKEVATSAQRVVRQRFSPTRIASELVGIYEEAVSGAEGRSETR